VGFAPILAWAAAVAALASWALLPVHAQDAPTDNDLFASYCVGALEQWSVHQQQTLRTPCSGAQTDSCNQVHDGVAASNAEVNEHLTHVKRYLMARGFFSGGQPRSSLTGLLVAKQSGEADTKRCLDWMNANLETILAETMKCTQQAGSPAQKACLEAGDPDFCRRSRRCDDTSRLPF
jgi:hypothetical protein